MDCWEGSLKLFLGQYWSFLFIQLDNTSFDIFITDSATRSYIGAPHLCAGIDVYTRMITGALLSVEPINSQRVLETDPSAQSFAKSTKDGAHSGLSELKRFI